MKRLLRWIWRGAWLWFPALVALALLIVAQMPSIERYQITQIETLPCTDLGQAWFEQKLPLVTRLDCTLIRIQFATPALRDRLTLLIGKSFRDVRISLNGLEVKALADIAWVAFSSQSQLVNLPSGSLNREQNEILLMLRTQSTVETAVLSKVYLGPREALQASYLRHIWLTNYGARFCMVMNFAVLLFLLPLLWQSKFDALYGWFALATISSAIYALHFAYAIRPMHQGIWWVLIHAALLFALLSFAQVSRLLILRSGHAPQFLSATALNLPKMLVSCGIVFLLLEGVFWHSKIRIYFDIGFRLCALGALLACASNWWCARRLIAFAHWFFSGLLLLIALALNDSWQVLGSNSLQTFLLHFGVLYLLIVLFAVLLSEIHAALIAAHSAKALLQTALSARERELEVAFTERTAAEAARALAEERQRIMRDMHDGVGGQLVAMIVRLDEHDAHDAPLRLALRTTLDDLRLMIDSLDDACSDLSVALGMLRQRLEPFSRGRDSESASPLPKLVWETAHLPDLPPAPPAHVLAVLRIVQEALTNALKHARASRIVISAQWQAPNLRILIADDGIGISTAPQNGRGLLSLRQRALEMGAQLEVGNNAPQGTTVCLAMRLDETPE
jgi:signal transduction histidine kinase